MVSNVGAVQPIVFPETHRLVKAYAALEHVSIPEAYKTLINSGIEQTHPHLLQEKI